MPITAGLQICIIHCLFSLRNRIENCSLSKIVEQYDLEGNKVAEYISAAEAGRIFGCNSRYISRVRAGERKSYKSFIWKYKV